MKKYKFVTRSLLLNESLKIAEIYNESKNWDIVKEIVLEENILQINTVHSQKKQLSEIKTRLELLSPQAIDLLLKTNLNEARLILLFALVKKYRLLLEFIIEVIRDKYLSLSFNLFENDFERFIRDKSNEYQEIYDWKESTKIKLKNTIFNILTEVKIIDLYGDHKIITKPFVPEEIIELIAIENPSLLGIFLMSDGDIKKYKEKYNQ